MPRHKCLKALPWSFAFFIWLHGQAVKTSPFHGGNTGSIPVGVILDSSMVEHSAVNRVVVGSSPTRGVWRHSQVVRHGSATP